MLLLIDNYDSFVYNLARYFVELGCETLVVRNDAIDVGALPGSSPYASSSMIGTLWRNATSANACLRYVDSVSVLGF